MFIMILLYSVSCQAYDANLKDARHYVVPSKLSYADDSPENRYASGSQYSTALPELLQAAGEKVNVRNSKSQYDGGSGVTLQTVAPRTSPFSQAERYAYIDDDRTSTGSGEFGAPPHRPPLLSAVRPAPEPFDRWPEADGDADSFGPYLQQQFTGVSGGQLLLQRLLFGRLQTVLQHPIDGYLSFCNRMAVVGRFLNRLFEPLFTAGFYTATSYIFRRIILPRIAHYIHVYTMMNGHHGPSHDSDAARSVDEGASLFGDLNAVLNAAASAASMVNGDAITDPPACLRKIVCEAGLTASSNAITHPFRR